jgi:DNA-binding GntR family transcriptional regulator
MRLAGGENGRRRRSGSPKRVVAKLDVRQILRERIARQELLPGSKLLEQDLSREFGISRARVRDALGVLEQRGLVKRIPNRGAVVARLELTEVFELYEVREMLEGLCARLATQNVPPDSWQDLVDIFDGPVESYVREGDLEAYVLTLESFRKRTIEAAVNSVLAEMLDSIHDRTRAIIRRIIVLPGRAQQGLLEHRAILKAMRAGDAGEAERLRRENMRSARAYLERYKTFVL